MLWGPVGMLDMGCSGGVLQRGWGRDWDTGGRLGCGGVVGMGGAQGSGSQPLGSIPVDPSPSPISPAGPEIPLASYPTPPPAPFPVDPKAGPVPPQPGFTPMAMYPPVGPAAQYPMYPSGPPVYNPTGEHCTPPTTARQTFWGYPH